MRYFFWLFVLLLPLHLTAQKIEIDLSKITFKKAGDVRKMADDCYELTNDFRWSSGAIWYPKPINLAEDFDMEVDVFLGCKDEEGADGIAFIFSPKLSIGRAGEGMGFSGLYPSLGIELDTWQNEHLGDPGEDHIAVLGNGNPSHHFNMTSPIPIGKNIEDCKNHLLKVAWKARQKVLLVTLEGKNLVRLQENITATIFKNDPKVYWGISAATGQFSNTHKVCFKKLEFDELPEELAFERAKKLALLKGDMLPLEQVRFESGKASLREGSQAELDKLVSLLKDHPEMHLGILGHTDSAGSNKTNKTLSQKRAESVANYLISKGILADRLNAKGMGERFPIASNREATGRIKNRRVEVYLYKPYP